MSCESLIEETCSYDFPYDWDASIFHFESVVSLKEVVQSISTFLNIFEELAYQFFFNTANSANIDLIGFIDGVCRPAKQEATKAMLECVRDEGNANDWFLSEWTGLDTTWLFHSKQIDTMMKEAVKGCEEPFSIKQILAEKKLAGGGSQYSGVIKNDLDVRFDPNSPTYPPELDLALRAWREVSANPQPKNKKGITTQIEQWLEKNNPDLSPAASKRIGIVANWYKAEIKPKKKTAKNN